MVVPLGYAIYTSLYTYRIIGGTTFTGASNYTQTLQNGLFWNGVIRVIIFAAIQIPVMLAIAFFFACVFDLGVANFGRTFRTTFATGAAACCSAASRTREYAMPAITLEKVTKVFATGVTALDELTLDVSDGEFVVLVGPAAPDRGKRG